MTQQPHDRLQPRSRRGARGFAVHAGAALAAALGIGLPAQAQTALADQPPLTSYTVPGNLALALSVEFPTAVSVAHTNRAYSAGNEYLGYFDPKKCYVYTYDPSDSTANPNASAPASYFSPSGAASTHLCSGKWSGNFLNWASMQTIDTFRWVLTGGYRVIDTASLSVVEKAWGSGQGGTGNFPDSSLAASDLAGATPFGPPNNLGMTVRIAGQGNKMRFNVSQQLTYDVKYYNSTNRSGPLIIETTETGTSSIKDFASPAPGVSANQFSAEFISQTTAPATGSYVFQIYSDDDSQVYINNTQVVSGNYYTGRQNSAAINFNAGDIINIKIDYVQGGGGAHLNLLWTTPLNSTFTEVSKGTDLGGNGQPYTNGAVSLSNLYDVFIRAKVCDGSSGAGGLESNCTAYGSNAKPEGLMQKYNRQLRYSVFGYLNDGSPSRDAGVMRAKQKFVGPYRPAYALPDVSNSAAEWDSTTGVFVRNPDTSDASATGVIDSGVLNYLNKFGEITHQGYKTYDPVSELYYAALRYFRNLGNVPQWSDLSGLNASDQARLVDGFPVITNWVDPVIYSCQRNFVLGIGDVHTWLDKNVPGNTNSNGEPTLPPLVASDNTSNAVTATLQVGKLEGFTAASTLNAMLGNPGWGECCTANSALMAGLAYDAHTSDIRPDLLGKIRPMTVDTYWVDVQESQKYVLNNQFYLATKYGGFTVPTGFKPYDPAAALTDASWWNGSAVDSVSGQKLPNNYFSGGRPDLMQSGLNSAFAAIAASSGQVNTSVGAFALPQFGSSGTSTYSASFDAGSWSGKLNGYVATFSSTGVLTQTPGGEFGSVLNAQGPTHRSIATWDPVGLRGVQFEATASAGAGATALNAAQLGALDTNYVSGIDSTDFLNYLRGDRSKEKVSGATTADPTRPYRSRASLLGDIVNSKPTAVGPPAYAFADSANPGYSAFKSAKAARPTVVYVGANDGMLHAVSGDLATSTAAGAGSELFAYVPNALFQGPNGTPNTDGLASLGNPAFTHHYMVDATAFAFDIDLARTSNGTTAPPTTWTPDWHTVLIGGLGKGGKAIYAIDVTDPSSMTNEVTLASKVLWEFTQPQYLGFTYGEPAVVKTRRFGWVVAVPSGYNNADGFGHVMFLNPKTGQLLATVTMPSGSTGLAHLEAFVVDATDGTADAFYAGDLQGNLWRVDVTGAFGGAAYAPVLLAQFSDGGTSSAPQPVTTRPSVAVDPATGKRFVMVGTGRLLDSSDIGRAVPNGQVQSFYAIADGTNGAFNATPLTGVTFPITRAQLADDTLNLTGSVGGSSTTAAGWFIDLSTAGTGPTARTLVESQTAGALVTFSSVEPNGDACQPGGTGSVYVVNFGSARSVLLNSSGVLTTSQPTQGGAATDNVLVNRNGVLSALVGSGGNLAPLQTQPGGGYSPRRVNWREVPTAD